jgi:outer membrane protein assembly factor BamB
MTKGQSRFRFLGKVRVANDTVFVPPPIIDGDAMFAGHHQGAVKRFDTRTLKMLWSVEAHGHEPWFVSNGMLVMSSKRSTFVGLSLDGEQRWSFRPQQKAWLRWREFLVGMGPRLQLVDVRSGEIVEEIQHDLPTGYSGWVCGDLLVVVTSHAEPVVGYDLCARRVAWRSDVFGALRSLGAWEDNLLLKLSDEAHGALVGSRGQKLFAIDRHTGEALWVANVWVPLMPGVANGRVFGWESGRHDGGRVVSLEQSTGAVLFDRRVSELHPILAEYQEPSPPAISDEWVAFTTRRGTVVVFDASVGTVLMTYRHRAEMFPPVVADRRVFAGGSDGYVLGWEDAGSRTGPPHAS